MKNLFLFFGLIVAVAVHAQITITTVGSAGKSSLSPSIMYAPGSTSRLVVVTQTRGGSDIGHFLSTNAGSSWSGSRSITGLTGASPVAAIDQNAGYVYVAYGKGSALTSDAKIMVGRSTDWGSTWTITDSIAADFNSASNEKSITIAVDTSSFRRGRVYVAWTGFAGTQVCHSTDHAVTFSAAHTVAHDASGQWQFSYPELAVTGTGGLCAFYLVPNSTQHNNTLYGIVSGDGDSTYGTAVLLANVGQNLTQRPYASGVSAQNMICLVTLTSTGLNVQITTDGWQTTSFSGLLLGTQANRGIAATGVDSTGTIFVAWYQGPTAGGAYTNLQIAHSLDTTQTWRLDTLSVCSFSSTSAYDTIGAAFGLCNMGNHRIGIAYAGVGDSLHVAVVQWGTVFRNEFNQTFAYTQQYFLQSDTTHKKTVHFYDVQTLMQDTAYLARPDSMQHYALHDSTGNNFRFLRWNETRPIQLIDSSFTHQLQAQGLTLDAQTSNYKRVDSVFAKNDLEGGSADSLWWSIGFDQAITNIVPSVFTIDSAFRSVNNITKYYNFKAKSALGSSTSPTVLNTYWWPEAWSKNDTVVNIGATSYGNVKVFGKTRVSALMKGHLRSADTWGALDFNNARKTCYDHGNNKHDLVYESRGNIYFSSSVTDTFCGFSQEKKLNTGYGNAFHPGIAALNFTGGSPQPNNVYVVWDETAPVSADSVKHYVMFRSRHTDGKWQGEDTSIIGGEPMVLIVDSCVTSVNAVDAPAPSVCATRTEDGYTISSVIRGAIAWHRDSTVWVAAIVPQPGQEIIGPKRCIDNAFHGSYVSIEPGYLGVDSLFASPNPHTADFHVAWHDTSMGNSGYDGGLRYRYLTYKTATQWNAPYPTDQIMNNYWEVAPSDPWGRPQHPSLCISKDHGHPIIVSYILDEKSTYLAMPYDTNFSSFKRRSGIYVRIKDSVTGSWGLFRIIAKYNDKPLLYAPSVSCYDDLSNYYRAAWWRFDSLSSTNVLETIQHGLWPFTDPTVGASGRDYYTDTTTIIKGDTAARSPHLEYGQFTTKADSGILCNRRNAALPRTIKRANVNCDIQDNRTPAPLHRSDEITAYSGSAFGRISVGEFKIIDSTGGNTEVPLMKEMMLKPAAKPSEIQNVNGSVYFKLPNNAKYFIYFRAPSVNDTVDLHEFSGTKSIRFTTELVDSATDIPFMSLDQQSFMNGAAATHCGFDTTAVGATASLHKTFYVRTRVDTGSGFSNLHFSCARINSEDKLSAVLAHGSGLGKQAMHYFGRAGLVPEEVNPIALEVFPNPSSSGMKPTVSFTIPVEDADDIAEVKVFDILVRDVSTLVHDFKPAGRFQVTFDGTLLPAGRYIVAVHLRTHQQSKLIILNR